MVQEEGRLLHTVRRVLMEAVCKRNWDAYLQQARALAMTDSLTSLYSRFFIEHLLEMEIKRSQRYDHAFCVAYIDIDGFKEINDRFGHSHGDAVLRELAMVLKNLLRSTDYLGRFGGDEFLLILPKANLVNAVRLCRRMTEKVSRHTFQGKRAKHGLTISIGLSHWKGGEGIRSPQLLEAADQALYQAKKRGKNCICQHENPFPTAS